MPGERTPVYRLDPPTNFLFFGVLPVDNGNCSVYGGRMVDRIASSRREAREVGLRFYFTGEPCSHGHIAVRSTITGTCVECQRKSTRESQKRIRGKAKKKIERREQAEKAHVEELA